MRHLEGGRMWRPRAGFMNRPMDAPLKTAEIGETPRRRSVERREAQAPTSLGLRIPGGGPRWARPSCAGRSLRKGLAKGASQAPMGSRKLLAPPGAPSPRFGGGTEKRGWAYPAPENKEY